MAETDARTGAWRGPGAIRDVRILVAVAAAATAARIVWAASVQLAPDEALYWTWSREATLAYRDHPPLLAWIMAAVPGPLSDASDLWVRAPAIASGFAMFFAAFLLCRASGAASAWSLVASITGCLSLMGCAGAVIVTPDAPLLVAWTLGLAALARLASGGSPWLLAAAAACAGLACLAKLPGILLVAPMAAAVAARSREIRRMALPLCAAAAILAVAVAVLALGEASPGPGPVEFQSGRIASVALHPAGPFVFLASQIGLVGVLPAAGAWALPPRDLVPRSSASVLAWGFWPAIAGVTIVSLILRAEPNWGAVAFPSLVAGWAIVLDRASAARPALGRSLGLGGLALNLGIAVVVHLHAAGVLAPGMVGKGPAARLHGWREIALVVHATDPGPLVTDDYEVWAPLVRYGRGDPPVALVDRPAGGELPCEPRSWVYEDGRLGLARRVDLWPACPPVTAVPRPWRGTRPPR